MATLHAVPHNSIFSEKYDTRQNVVKRHSTVTTFDNESTLGNHRRKFPHNLYLVNDT